MGDARDEAVVRKTLVLSRNPVLTAAQPRRKLCETTFGTAEQRPILTPRSRLKEVRSAAPLGVVGWMYG